MPSFAELRQFLGGQILEIPQLPDVNLNGKTMIVTGANTGLGYACAQHLCNLGVSELILACRTAQKGEAARDSMLNSLQSPNKPSIHVWELDLANYDSVIAFAKRAQAQLTRLDGVVMNAGVELTTFEISEGLEQTLTVNVVSTFLLSTLLLRKLKESSLAFDTSPHLTIVGSLITVFAPFSQLLCGTETDIFSELSNPQTADMGSRYPLSKLMGHLCARELAKTLSSSKDKSLQRLVVNHVNPGWCRSELIRNKGEDFASRFLLPVIGRSCEMGSRPLVHAVTAGKETHGKYLSECKVKPEAEWVTSVEGDQVQKRLWKELVSRLDDISPGLMKDFE